MIARAYPTRKWEARSAVLAIAPAKPSNASVAAPPPAIRIARTIHLLEAAGHANPAAVLPDDAASWFATIIEPRRSRSGHRPGATAHAPIRPSRSSAEMPEAKGVDFP